MNEALKAEVLLNARIALTSVTRRPVEGWQERCMAALGPLAKVFGVEKEELWAAWSNYHGLTVTMDALGSDRSTP